MNNLIKVNNQDLQVKEFNGQRVVTFKDIDLLHERVEGTAGRNFRENRKHFIEKQDFYYITGDELKDLKQTTDFVGSNAKELIFITESGYLMLVKSFTDDLAWKVQRELVNSYFRPKEQKQLSALDQLRLQYQVIEEHDKKIDGVVKKVDNLQANMPLFNVECKELQALVKRIGTKALGGYKSPAYNNNSLRGKVYSDIQHQLRREFGVERYEAIKRCQLDSARKIVENYKVPLVLENEIHAANNQVGMEAI